MNNLIIGTAGHVDHGKTTLIKVLTGTDTDRLKAEKERGITIELGFAYFTLPNGERCGIIDVPGHEKFVRNMLAGAGSIDLALFVVAADEGIMPQSREHLEILTLLGIKRGIIVVTKSDIVEKEWLEMVILDIKNEVKDTFLENAEVIPVSAKSGEGIDNLKKSLTDMILSDLDAPVKLLPARLPIDRVFTVDGFGTVITGTLTDGEIFTGDELMLFPQMLKTKVRGLQVHSLSVKSAKKGQRVAVNLSGVKTEDIKKGCVLSVADAMQNSKVLDVRLDAVKNLKHKIVNNSRLHFYHGTADVTCRVNLLTKQELNSGESCYARLFTEEPISARAGDRFVVRFYSPLETVGGGVIIDPNPQSKALGEKGATLLKTKEKGRLSERLACFILDRSKTFPLIKDLKVNPFLGLDEFDKALLSLTTNKEVFIVKDSVIHKDYLMGLAAKSHTVLQDFHTKNPLLEGVKKEELRFKLLPKAFSAFFDEILSVLHQEKLIKLNNNIVSDIDFKIAFNENQQKLHDELADIFLKGGFSTPSLDEIAANYISKQKIFKQAIDSLIAKGILIVLTPQIIVHKDFFDKAVNVVNNLAKNNLAENGQFSLAQFRDEIQSSRKYAVALLEYFDNKGITKKQGDFRMLK